MGAWGTGAFDNDDALDWLVRLEDGGVEVVRQALAGVLSATPGYFERDVGASAIAAAEVVAALRGRPHRDLPPVLTAWVTAHGEAAADEQLSCDAQRALDVAANPVVSEFAELWDETPDAAAWTITLADLRARLS